MNKQCYSYEYKAAAHCYSFEYLELHRKVGRNENSYWVILKSGYIIAIALKSAVINLSSSNFVTYR